MSDGSKVVPVYRIIANGGEVRKDGNGEDRRVLFVTLLATPLKVLEGTEEAFPLSDWPKHMADSMAPRIGPDGKIEDSSLGMLVRRPPAGGPDDENTVTIRPRNSRAYTSSAWARVNELWQDTLAPDEAAWSDLADNIAASLKGTQRQAEEQFGAPSTLSSDQLHDDGALIAPRPNSNTKEVIVGALSVKQGNFAVSEETLRAARIAAKVFKGPAVVVDETKEELAGPDMTTINEEASDFREDAFERYNKLIDEKTKPARERSTALFHALDSILKNETADLTEAPDEDKPAVVPDRRKVIFVKRLENNRPTVDGDSPEYPSHDYYTWPQRPKDLVAKSSTGRAIPVASVTDSNVFQAMKKEAEGIGHARAMFFAFQSDPTLARLFGLAFDCEIDEDALRSAFPNGDSDFGDWLLHLAPEKNPHIKAQGDIPIVATAALLKSGESRHIRFWPVSIFREPVYAADAAPQLDALVDQEDGVFLCGKERLGGGQRYEITALDFRHSIETKGSLQDRGQAMHSGGLAILDRGRADQIVRDLALFKHAKDQLKSPNDWFVLHAEELTVGCKVDVALVGAASDSAPPQWRSLMQRYVDFEFGPHDATVEALLWLLIPGSERSKRLREETAQKQTARTIPIGHQTTDDLGNLIERRVEVIAEENIFLWTGSPVAVEVNSDQSSVPSPLPFTRKLDLPSASAEPKLRPPPLRYGMPYAFRMRATFLGGGSPSTEEAAEADAAATVMPGGTAAAIRARRFLRHEGIREPTLLLPRHRALTRWGVMGFEQADQAIVRTIDTSGSPFVAASDRSDAVEPKDKAREEKERRDAEAEVGGIYLGLARRDQPKETMRIFVPPEAPQGVLERHQELDAGNAAAVLQGGLKDAVFTPHPKPKPIGLLKEAPQGASGFPIAVTVRIDALDSDGAIDRREYFKADNQDGIAGRSGIPIFEPGIRQPAKVGETGYLPDPAVATYCLRARIRGSDVYLAGHLPVKIYEGTLYPDALPLAIVVQRKGVGPLHRRPTKIAEIATAKGPFFLDSKGRFSRTKSTGSSRVQRVDVVLGVHDDFDLEISCLPDKDRLAREFALTETIAVQLGVAGWLADFNKHDELGLGILPPVGGGYTGVGGKRAPRPSELGDVAAMLIKAMTEHWPIEEIAATRRLRVCHALNLPTAPARWRKEGDNAPILVSHRPAKQNEGNGRDATEVKSEANVDAQGALNDKPKANPEKKPPLDVWQPLPSEEENEAGVDALLSGTIELDLAEIDGFDIIARTVGVDGQPLDDKQRGRSPISKRSGRWPKIIREDGRLSNAPVKTAYGFEVAEDGTVALPRANVTLLSVRNLPTYGAIGTTAGEPKDGIKLFTTDEKSQRTAVALSPLFVAAFRGHSIKQKIAMPDKAEDSSQRTRLIKIERPHLFKDTLARSLDVSIAAISRHASDFETAPLYVDEKGIAQNLFRRQALVHGDQTVFSKEMETATVWINATRRPNACDVRRPEPAFVIRRESKRSPDGSVTHKLARRALSRIWLGRGWYSSGEGERLGIVLWPPHYETLKDLKLEKNLVPIPGRDGDVALLDFQDSDLGEGGAFVTRWGGDPTREDIVPQTGFFIPPSAFGELDPTEAARLADNPHKPRSAETVRMPVARHAQGGQESSKSEPIDYLEVTLLTYEPCFDLDREEWFVDVDLRTKSAAEPFVRFGLVRYQEHAISEDLKVSEPVSAMMQLLPDRTVAITRHQQTAEAKEERLDIRVYGPAGKAVKPVKVTLPAEADQRDRKESSKRRSEMLDRPHMKLTLFHESKMNGFLTRVPASEMYRDPIELDFEGTGNGEFAGNLVWHKSITFSNRDLAVLGKGTLVAYVEEIDRRMPASYRREPVSLATMLDESTFVDSGPRFAARVPVIEL